MLKIFCLQKGMGVAMKNSEVIRNLSKQQSHFGIYLN